MVFECEEGLRRRCSPLRTVGGDWPVDLLSCGCATTKAMRLVGRLYAWEGKLCAWLRGAMRYPAVDFCVVDIKALELVCAEAYCS